MSGPATRASSATDDRSAEAAVDALATDGEVAFQIEGDERRGRTSGYSILVQGSVQASSVLSSTAPGESVVVLEDDTKLLSGTVRAGTAGFVVDGEVLAAEFDDPAPTIRLDGEVVDPDRWPTVKGYLGSGARQDPVEDPFPNSGELGKPRGDPLDPLESVVVLEARETEDAGAYCLDLDGEVLEYPDSASISASGDRIFGYLYPGWSVRIAIRGAVTRVDTADGIRFSAHAAE